MNPEALQGVLDPALIAAMRHARVLRAEAMQQALRNLFEFRRGDDVLARRDAWDGDTALEPRRLVP
jgi:hypothetical protein